MIVGVRKFNPGFLSDDEIVASFCARNAELALLLETLLASDGNSNVHSLVIGPRGSGKTHLLLRLAAEIRRNSSLSKFYPIVFAEESYEVSTVGEFWLECLGHLAEQAPESERTDLRLSYNDLRSLSNDRDLAGRCLGTILDFADRHAKRVVLMVENLNMLFADMDDSEAGWRLRHTLQTEPRVVLLGSATSRFDEIDHPDHAMYNLFRVITLRPLSTQECKALWKNVTAQPATSLVIRPLEILTGGNPRLLTIVAQFGAGRSFRELMGNLLDLVDDHTEYFKSHLESLPPLERRVYLSLARLWKPATAREVANQGRLDVNRCSALLGRLMDRGAVVVVGGTPRRKQYYLTERLYNIYYLLRRESGASRAVESLIDFMVCLYSPTELWDIVTDIYRESLLESTDVQEPVAQVLIKKAQLLADLGHDNEAIAILEQVADRLRMTEVTAGRHQAAVALLNKVLRLNLSGRYHEGIGGCDQMLATLGTSRNPEVIVMLGIALDSKGRAWAQLGNANEAVFAYNQALEYFTSVSTTELSELVADTMNRKGLALMQSQQPNEAAATFDVVAKRYATANTKGVLEKVTSALLAKAAALLVQGRNLPESDFTLLLSCLDKEGELRPGFIQALTQLAATFGVSRALELIQTSPAADLLSPLITALQQELGEETHVAREVDEVASDVRRNLAEVSFEMLLSEVTGSVGSTSRQLESELNLNQSRLDRLNKGVRAVDNYLKDHLTGYQKMERQGSYALGTLIKPVDDNDEYDADIQVIMNPNPKWQAKEYINEIHRTLKQNQNYADKLRLKTRCVTIDYAGDFHLDVVPRVTIGGRHYVCNRTDNSFEETDGTGYRDWFNEKNRKTAGNLKRVVRLLKYLRDHKNNYTAKSILLTTLAGNTIRPSDERTEAVSTVADTLVTVLTRMDDYLQQHPYMPEIRNPVLPTENFNRHWDQTKYANFRNRIVSYAQTAQQARNEPTAEKALKRWRELFQDGDCYSTPIGQETYDGCPNSD